MKPLSIAIVGYGTAGQAAALLLHRAGHGMEIFEQTAEPGPAGAGVLVQPTGLQVLENLGLLAGALRCGARVEVLSGHSHRGRQVMDLQYRQLHPGLFGLGMQRGALFSLLDQAGPLRASLRCGCAVVAVDTAAGTLTDAAGQGYGPYDLIVVADGSGSRLRSAGYASLVRRDALYPWGAVWCLRDDPDDHYSLQLRQRYRSSRQMLGVLPVGRLPGEASSQRRVSLFWSLSERSLGDWSPEAYPAMREQALELWPEIGELLDQPGTAQALTRARYRDVVMRRSYLGKTVLIGDAAHAMSPQLGQGVNMALMDAQALASALDRGGSLDSALASYDHERRRHVAIYQLWSRWLTPIFQSHASIPALLRDQLFLPLGKLQPGKGQMLRVLTGTQQGLFGSLKLDLDTLAERLQSAVRSEAVEDSRPVSADCTTA